MFDKYEIRTYPEYVQFDDSDTESDLKKTTASSKKMTYINPKRISLNQTECIFTNDNNISFYQSDLKSSYKERKYKSLNRNLKNRNDEFDLFKKKTNLIFQPYYVEEQFSYNYTNTEDNNENNTNNNTPLTQRILLDNYLRKSSHQVPKRTIKAYQNQFDVEKSDNFNVLSYKQPEYESDIPTKEGKSKIIQIFKKEEAGELFFPSKRVQSPQSPSSSNNSGKKTKLFSYQTPTLKFQSFFGSNTRAKNPKITQAKSTSKRKANQFEDFNIDKLIEIGDNKSKNLKHILSFGKKINKIKNKNKKKINLNYNTNKDLRFNHLDLEEKSKMQKKEDNLMGIVQISPKRIENQEINNNNINNSNIINDNNNNNSKENKKLMTKKIVYHGQIKRKRNINNTKDFMNSNKVIPNENQIQGNININRNGNSAKEILSNDNIINSNNNNNLNNSSIKLKMLSTNRKLKDNEHLFNKTKANSLCHQITPKKALQKKKININLTDNLKYSINYDNLYNILQKNNKYINNYTKMNLGNSVSFGNKTLNDIPKKTVLTEENENDNKNYIQKIKPSLKKAIINESENPIKRFNKNQTNTHIYISKANNNNNSNNNSNNANNQASKKMSDKVFKAKNYYGYDERHNLEGPINNHSYYVSVYSKKNINQKNLSTDKIN